MNKSYKRLNTMKRLFLLIPLVALVSACADKESQEIAKIKETDSYYKCVMRASSDLTAITPTMEKMIQKKCIDEYRAVMERIRSDIRNYVVPEKNRPNKKTGFKGGLTRCDVLETC